LGDIILVKAAAARARVKRRMDIIRRPVKPARA